jgi:AraC-like DNA-binding protein
MQTVKDTGLSNSQLGFLSRLLSKPDTWEYHPRQIAEEFGLSLRSVHRMFDALAGKAYIVRHDTRVHDLSTGQWSRIVEYKVYASLKLRLEDNEVSERHIRHTDNFKVLPEDRKTALGP